MKQPTFNDFKNATPEELRRTYKLDSRQLEQAHHKVMEGATRQDLQKAYESFYDPNRRK